jgi:hypothetical protein
MFYEKPNSIVTTDWFNRAEGWIKVKHWNWKVVLNAKLVPSWFLVLTNYYCNSRFVFDFFRLPVKMLTISFSIVELRYADSMRAIHCFHLTNLHLNLFPTHLCSSRDPLQAFSHSKPFVKFKITIFLTLKLTFWVTKHCKHDSTVLSYMINIGLALCEKRIQSP